MKHHLHGGAAQSARLLHGADYNYEQWLEYPEILDADFAAMKLAGCTTMTVGIFSWSRYEPRDGEFDFSWMDRLLDRLHENGLTAILATPSGSKPAWLSQAYPESCMIDVHGHRQNHGLRHNHCRSSPIYRQKVAIIDRQLAQRYAGHPALALWHVSNEYGASRCYCPHCLSAFHGWLKQRYGSLDALNHAWWTDFWSHRFSDWSQIFPNDTSLNGMMLDWARFTSDQTIDFFLAEKAVLREFSPDIPITTNFMTPDVGLDYYRLARHLDVVSWDNYPNWHAEGDDVAVADKTAFLHDFFRSCKGAPFLLMESTPSCTNWQGVSPLKRPGMHQLASLQAVAHGSDSVLYFQWRQSRGGEEKFHGAVLSHQGSTQTRTFTDVIQMGNLLDKLPQLAGASIKADVAVIYDFESGWALDLAQLPRSQDKAYQAECLAHHRALRRLGIQVDVIDSFERDFSGYKMLVAPMLYLLRPGVAQSLTTFVQGGGILVTGYLTGLVDESDLCFLGGAPGPLSEVMGLQVEETDAVPTARGQSVQVDFMAKPGQSWPASHYADHLQLAGAQVMARYELDFLAGQAAITRNQFGQGQAWYLGTRLNGDFLKEFYREICSGLSVARAFGRDLPKGVSAMRRETAQGPVVFLMNFNELPIEIDLDKGSWRNLVNDQIVQGRLLLPAFGLGLLTVL